MRCKPLLIMVVALSGCAPLDTAYSPIEVDIEVRDAMTLEPIEGARVLGSVNIFYYPESQDNMFGRPGVIPGFVEINEPAGWHIVTNDSGTARTRVAGGNPTYLFIMADGYPSAEGRIETTATTSNGAVGWTRGFVQPVLHGVPRDNSRLEYRVRSLQRPAQPGTE